MDARIGPNAILQLLPVLDKELGLAGRQGLFARAAVPVPAADAGMLPQDHVIRLHRALCGASDRAPTLLRAAGLGTGDYILANRIPRPAKALIRALPAPLGARLLAMAIAKHAWTFAGSGQFRVTGHRPLTFAIASNPLATGDSCHWHQAVFERLFASLVWPGVRVEESCCCGRGDALCQFHLRAE